MLHGEDIHGVLPCPLVPGLLATHEGAVLLHIPFYFFTSRKTFSPAFPDKAGATRRARGSPRNSVPYNEMMSNRSFKSNHVKIKTGRDV